MKKPALTRDLLFELPKSDLHLHLDGSLRLDTLIELAASRKVKLPSATPEGLLELVFKRAYKNLPEYLKGFEFTVACLQDAEALERVAYELAWDCRKENVFYVEVRFAPQLHVRGDFGVREVLRAVCKGLQRAEKEINNDPSVKSGQLPRFRSGVIVCALRFFLPVFGEHYRAYFEALPSAKPEEIYALASLELARAAVAAKEVDGLPVVGLDLAGQEHGFPAKDHQAAYQLAHEHFLGKTVHAGEDYGPESIFQAITDCHADRIGHGTWLFSKRHIKDKSIVDKQAYVDRLVQYVAERRITLEVCLTSNQQTIPELRTDLRKHPFKKMRESRCSVTLCTDNRLVSRTTMTDEVEKAVTAFKLEPRGLKDVLTYGFKRSFFPGSYPEKRDWVRSVVNRMEDVFLAAGFDLRGGRR
ncbi:MAG: adenosine deaminase family protein [Planctomycetes bacterium]|nr:adenosine deaminase family protein [Planctomycetota bacterium]MCB9884968.1 adenosine deaminase family protein [Planctomycetota bacterium]